MDAADWLRLSVFLAQQTALIAGIVMAVIAHRKWRKGNHMDALWVMAISIWMIAATR